MKLSNLRYSLSSETLWALAPFVQLVFSVQCWLIATLIALINQWLMCHVLFQQGDASQARTNGSCGS